MALVCSESFAIKLHGNGFVTGAVIIEVEDPLNDGGSILINDRSADGSRTLMALLFFDDFLFVSVRWAEDEMPICRPLLQTLHDFPG